MEKKTEGINWFEYDPDTPCINCLIRPSCIISVEYSEDWKRYNIGVKKKCPLLRLHLETSERYRRRTVLKYVDALNQNAILYSGYIYMAYKE
jgi:hypothetical protein